MIQHLAAALALSLPMAAAGSFELIAHRGAHPVPDSANEDPACPGVRVARGGPGTVENTLPAFRAAFDLGATMVELDIWRSADDQLVVFHDERVDCKTEGAGRVAELTAAALGRLDPGYRYSDDGGASHRWRGLPDSRIPTLDEVLAEFPRRGLLLHQKALDPKTTQLLAARLGKISPALLQRIRYWGPEHAFRVLLDQAPALVPARFMGWGSLRWCLLHHASLGWLSGGVGACTGHALLLPDARVAAFPGVFRRFAQDARERGASIYLVAQGIEDLESAAGLPLDGVMTDRVEQLGPHLQQSGRLAAP